MNQPINNLEAVKPDTLSPEDFVISPEAYISRDYAEREYDQLWSKVWQMACRVEEIPRVGDFVTYDILDQSIIVVRSDTETISAYHNVCPHRGRTLTEGCGHAKRFACKFHGWKWSLDGENIEVLDRKDWDGALTDEDVRLHKVKVDTFAGYVFINLDPDCEPLRDYLEPAASLLDPYEIEHMRFRWRRWLKMPCNWKVALEAFDEGYHVAATHTQLLEHTDDYTWSNAWGKHGNFGYYLPPDSRVTGEGSPRVHDSPRKDMTKSLADSFTGLKRDVDAFISDSMVAAAKRVHEELPADTPAMDAFIQMNMWMMEIDAAAGVKAPMITPEHYLMAGMDWHVFPNIVILQAPTFVLGYRARPDGTDPNSCIFEVYTLDRYAEGQEPKDVKNEHVPELADWPLILQQDFQNMAQVQRGLHSKAFRGCRPNPKQERSPANFHRTLRKFMAR